MTVLFFLIIVENKNKNFYKIFKLLLTFLILILDLKILLYLYLNKLDYITKILLLL